MHPRRRTRPQGEITRGKTAHNRLRPLDVYLCEHERTLLARRDGAFADAPVVDLGYGCLPWTTLEMAHRLRRIAPGLPVVGLEIDPDRVEAAQPWAGPGLTFQRGGFEVPTDRPARLVRAMNVLRQYDESAVEPAWRLVSERLLPGGLLVEGTSDPPGRLVVVNLLRRGAHGLALEGLLLYARPRADFTPDAWKAVLPKRWIHRVVPPEPIHAFFEAWEASWRATAPARAFGVRQGFEAAVRHLADRVPGVSTRRWLLRRGYLLWRAAPLAGALSR